MDFLIFSRGAAGAGDLEDDQALDEAHWSYMDRFADDMIARGPMLAADRTTWTGSIHIVDLPHPEAAQAFAEDEPYSRAGLFSQHVIRRFENRLGRTMWDFRGTFSDPRFFVVAHRHADADDQAPDALPDATALGSEGLIVAGDLRTLDDGRPAGFALALPAPSRDVVAALLHQQLAAQDRSFDVEVVDWKFGGRR
jgi:uncharacterized protein YciI